jgi:hypothetical protein
MTRSPPLADDSAAEPAQVGVDPGDTVGVPGGGVQQGDLVGQGVVGGLPRPAGLFAGPSGVERGRSLSFTKRTAAFRSNAIVSACSRFCRRSRRSSSRSAVVNSPGVPLTAVGSGPAGPVPQPFGADPELPGHLGDGPAGGTDEGDRVPLELLRVPTAAVALTSHPAPLPLEPHVPVSRCPASSGSFTQRLTHDYVRAETISPAALEVATPAGQPGFPRPGRRT